MDSFSPEKLSIINLRIGECAYQRVLDDTPYRTKATVSQGMVLEDELIMVEIFFRFIQGDSPGEENVIGLFSLMVVFHYDGLAQLVETKEDEYSMDPLLAQSLKGITYSTARGVFYMHAKGTAFENHIFEVISPALIPIES